MRFLFPGKTSKGQSQKVQQAVLEKFRAGGYNVIVATSIGEEGLDIMEVDLVICFDANVSPLRMIQRMGRTGRKHEGRVDILLLFNLLVLACEGSELKGYRRKQANSKAIKKHMRNGGINSFNFHSSPRMIPHIFKPEVQFVELSIKQFIPRGKKVTDEHPVQIPVFKTKLTDAETDLIANYFHPTRENTWKPSLIAFPHFQAFPSRVHRVVHSLRTGMLIETMQRLQGLSFLRDSKAFSVQEEAASELCRRVEPVEHPDNVMKGAPPSPSTPQNCHEPISSIFLRFIQHMQRVMIVCWKGGALVGQRIVVQCSLVGAYNSGECGCGNGIVIYVELWCLKTWMQRCGAKVGGRDCGGGNGPC
ncbi:unnamed protein product [Ilex paraguariensis]|uniref:Helicase C-terminal domain-containing protein n=1 Tax=Ilex paraguariensis TaxID=185542 RepID=A0ABC8SZ90_9AQUA